MNYFISHIILSIFSKYFLSFFVSVIGGTGLVSLIDAREARKQHQKDITITEIRKFRKRIQVYNKLFSKNIHLRNYQTAEDILIENMFYISSWSVNIQFYGYKAHCEVSDSGLVLTYAITNASVHDVKVAETLLHEYPSHLVLADKRYISKNLKQKLQPRGTDLEIQPVLI